MNNNLILFISYWSIIQYLLLYWATDSMVNILFKHNL